MSADLFPGWESHWIPSEHGKIFARAGGDGPPLLLLHGFPQTHVIWHRMAAPLARHFRVVAMDLRGYGWSSAPKGDATHETYSKRAMGRDVIAVMEALGHAQFALMGHDRGARVGYRLALDQPGRLSHLITLDIVPTFAMWRAIEANPPAPARDHWRWLSRPTPLPERELAQDPLGWLHRTLALWSGTQDLAAFDRRALAAYEAAFNEPSRLHAMCEDYRAGATLDRQADEADLAAGRTIDAPLLALMGRAAGGPTGGLDALTEWRKLAPDAEVRAIEGGHFLPEENPQAVLAAALPFLQAQA
jgi:haloacetate dehalogenase